MYSGQGNYTLQFTQGLPGPPPPYQQAPPGPPFGRPPPGPSLPSAPHGPLVNQLGQQASPFFGRLAAPLAQQPVHLQPPTVNSSQYSQLPPPPPPPQVNVSAPVAPPYPLPRFSAPVPMLNSNAHFGMQQLPPPRIPPPTPQSNSQSQGQVLFRSSQPPHPGMLHAPFAPPWPVNVPAPPPPAPPPPFDLKTPASFAGKHPARDVHPPLVPATPPPPPPPPPSSPPPLPPSPPDPIPASENFPFNSVEGFTTNSKIDSEARKFNNAPVYFGDASRDHKERNMVLMVGGKASEDRGLTPPRPDETVVRNIEVLCQFIAKVGPEFENTARTKESGNPKFDFLFGGEPGSAAAVGHEYFLWMKKKYITEREPLKGLKHNALIGTLKTNISSQSGNLGHMDLPHSPAISDMDMEDDIGPADTGKGFGNANKEFNISTNVHPYASDNVEEQLHKGICLGGASSPVTSLMDAEDEKESSVFEDVSPDRGSPDTAGLGDGTHALNRFSSRDSIIGNVSPDYESTKFQGASGVYLKYGSPFRLIQDYASDESDNENVRSVDESTNPVSPQATTGTSSLQQEKQSHTCSNFVGHDLSTVENENGSGCCTTSFLLSPPSLQGVFQSPEKSVPSTTKFDTMEENVDPNVYQVQNMLNDRSKTTIHSSEYGAPEGRKTNADQETEKLHSKESLTKQNASHDVDEFGRLVRKGASGSDSDRSPYGERHAKRGRSPSRSLSRSPRGTRRRRRSRSPRRRDNRSHSHSWSPKRRRSKSPQLFRSNMIARRGRDPPPDCFNFIRGRCFYGASCRFLHRDSGHLNMQQRYQDSRRPRYLHCSDNLSLSKTIRHDKSGFTELSAEQCNKLVEADDTITQTCSGKFLDGKDEPISMPEAEDASNLVSLKMTPEAENAMSPEVIPEESELSIPASQKMTPEADDASNVVFQETVTEAEVAGIPVSREKVSTEHESPVGEVPCTSFDGGTTQPISESSEPFHGDSLSVQSSPVKSASPPQLGAFEQPSPVDAFPLELSQCNTHSGASEAEKSCQHALPVQTSQSTSLPIQASTFQVSVGDDISVEGTADQNITTSMYSHDGTFMEPSVLPFHKEFSPHNLLMSGSNLPPPPPPHGQHSQPLLPPHGQHTQLLPPPHGQHTQPVPLPPPMHGQRPTHILNNSSSGLFSSQHFRENIAPPMTNYHSQMSPEPYMFYPQRAPLPSNLQGNQPNLPCPDQHMVSLHRRPPFPSSETSQLHYQHNSFPPRNDFMPLVRPYPLDDVPGSRPSSFYSQTFLSTPPIYPPRHPSFQPEQGGVHVQNHGLETPSSSMPLLRSFQGDRVDPRSYPREDFSTPGQSLYNQPIPASFGMTGTMHPSIHRYTENNFQQLPSDVGLPRFPIREHYNPYASAFEQPRGGDPGLSGPQIRRYDSSLSAENVPIVAAGFGMRSSPGGLKRSVEQVPRNGNYVHESSAEIIPDLKKLVVQEPVPGAPYDPLFDSIEPSSSASKMRVEEQNSGVNDTGSASKRRATKSVNKKNREGFAAEAKAEVDELGEVATDADAGGVENESPQLLDDKDWSPLIPFEVGETNVGEIEINQVKSPGKSKKSKDSRSMKLFKVAIADFAKEVLKPSWRQGNLSKEAFKTIVKKTVDKVAGAVPSHQLPKSQAKISQYVDSSQRKLTKLVMGYVDKYIKL